MSRILLIICFVAVAMSSAVIAGDDKPPRFKITTKRDTDTMEVRADKEKTVFIVKSPFGVGNAIIERTDEKWPDTVMVRLHLKALANFRVTDGKIKLDAAVSSHDHNQKVFLWKDGNKVSTLDAKSRYWMEIHMIDGHGAEARDGYFEMQLRKAFFESNPKSISLNWIDFFRKR